jgi:hypothetical protein
MRIAKLVGIEKRCVCVRGGGGVALSTCWSTNGSQFCINKGGASMELALCWLGGVVWLAVRALTNEMR